MMIRALLLIFFVSVQFSDAIFGVSLGMSAKSAQQESRDSDIVRGSYSYVDPLGSLITVNYEAGPMGYTETRNVQEKPASSFSSSNSGSSSLSSSSGISNSGSFSSGSSSLSSSNFGSNSFSDSSSNFGSNSFSGSSSSSLSSGQQSSSSFSQDDLISTVVEQIQPLVSGAVNSAISSSSSNRGSTTILSSSRPLRTSTSSTKTLSSPHTKTSAF